MLDISLNIFFFHIPLRKCYSSFANGTTYPYSFLFGSCVGSCRLKIIFIIGDEFPVSLFEVLREESAINKFNPISRLLIPVDSLRRLR